MIDECPDHQAVIGDVGKVVERAQTVTVPTTYFDAMVALLG